jgi:hypothetical protein
MLWTLACEWTQVWCAVKATCQSFFAVPLSVCLPTSSNWTTVTDLQNVLRLMIECQDASTVSSRKCDSFRRDLYIGLQCPQCVAPANAVAAATAVCGMITDEDRCFPEAAADADWEDVSPSDPPVVPAPDDLVLHAGAHQHTAEQVSSAEGFMSCW